MIRELPYELPRSWSSANRSSTVTACPSAARYRAAADPTPPEPMTTTRIAGGSLARQRARAQVRVSWRPASPTWEGHRTMDPDAAAPFMALLPVLLLLLLYFVRSIRQINQWEVALKFTLGQFSARLQPGLAL